MPKLVWTQTWRNDVMNMQINMWRHLPPQVPQNPVGNTVLSHNSLTKFGFILKHFLTSDYMKHRNSWKIANTHILYMTTHQLNSILILVLLYILPLLHVVSSLSCVNNVKQSCLIIAVQTSLPQYKQNSKTSTGWHILTIARYMLSYCPSPSSQCFDM